MDANLLDPEAIGDEEDEGRALSPLTIAPEAPAPIAKVDICIPNLDA